MWGCVGLRQPAMRAAADDGDGEDSEQQQLLSPDERPSESGPAPSSPRQRAERFARARLGLLMGLAGTFTFSLMTVCVRMVPLFGPPVPVFFIVFVRGVIVSASGECPSAPHPTRGWLTQAARCWQRSGRSAEDGYRCSGPRRTSHG